MLPNNECPNCGYKNRLSARFCGSCGEKLGTRAVSDASGDQTAINDSGYREAISSSGQDWNQQQGEKILALDKDHVGRDKIVKGDVVYGDKVGRDKISIRITEGQSYNVSGLSNPYLGLRSFTYADRQAYAGRAATVSRTVARLTAPGEQQVLLFITGTSGSGKSSFTQAGLLPALEAHYQDRHKEVRLAIMRPGTHPLAALADALAQIEMPMASPEAMASWEPAWLGRFLEINTPQSRVNLIVLDQFEEFFTQSPPEQRERFFAILAALPDFTCLRTFLIATLRSDYLDDLFAYQAIWEMTKTGVELRAMTAGEVKEAILGPLNAACLSDERYRQKRFEPALLEKLAKDTAQEAAYLPLLQVCLGELWNGGVLTLGNYHGLAAAIQERAEVVYAYEDFDATQPSKERTLEEQQALLSLLLDLVSVSLEGAGDEKSRDVRRRRGKHNLVRDAFRGSLVNDLVSARLLTVSLDGNVEMVEIIHEALIANWRRLQEAIDSFRQRLQQRRRFEVALKDWLAYGRSGDYLLLGVRLAEAEELELAGDIAVGSAEALDFLRHSQALAEAERRRELEQAQALAEEQSKRAEAEHRRAEDQERLTIRLRRRAMYLVGALIGALIAVIFAVSFWRNASTNEAKANREAQTARIGELSALALSELDQDHNLALLLSVEAYKSEQMLQTNYALYKTWAFRPLLKQYLHGQTSPVWSVASSPDGRLASGLQNGMVIVWDLNTGGVTHILDEHTFYVKSVAWSADGRLASGSWDDKVIIWDLENGEPAQILEGHSSWVNSVAWSPDGRLASGSNNGTVIVWDLESGQAAQILEGHDDDVKSVAWSADGRLASASIGSQSTSGEVIVWDLESSKAAQSLEGHNDWFNSVAWSQDGRLAIGSGSPATTDDGEVIVWDLESGQAAQVLMEHTRRVTSVAWSLDGQLASGSDDGSVVVWDLEHGEVAQVLHGHTSFVRGVAWLPDGRLASGSSSDHDSTVIIWDLDSKEVAQVLEGHTDEVTSVAWSSDGRLASGSDDGSVIVWDLEGRGIAQHFEWHIDKVNSVAWSPDGQLASGSDDDKVIVWNQESDQLIQIIEGHTLSVNSVAWSSDGRLASGSWDNKVIIWNLEKGEPAQILEGYKGYITSVAWSPDGRLASASGNEGLSVWSEIIVWDLNSDGVIRAPQDRTEHVSSLAWSPDGRLASGGCRESNQYGACTRGEIIFWNLESNQVVQVLGRKFQFNSLAWSPDGRLASGSSDGAVIIWDLEKGQVAQILEEHTGSINSVAWSKDGLLASGSTDNSVRVWQLDPQVWLQESCQRAGRNLTQAEWERFLYWKPYDPEYKTCPQWPSPAELEASQQVSE